MTHDFRSIADDLAKRLCKVDPPCGACLADAEAALQSAYARGIEDAAKVAEKKQIGRSVFRTGPKRGTSVYRYDGHVPSVIRALKDKQP